MTPEVPTPPDAETTADEAGPDDPGRRDFLRAALGITVAAPLAALFENVVAAAEKETEHHLSPKELKALIEKEWDAQNKMFEDIARDGMQKFYDSRPDKQKAFFTPEQIEKGGGASCACCSDERCNKYTNGTGEKMQLIRTPGSGILEALDLPDKDPFATDFIDSTAKLNNKLGVTVFTYHERCGAAGEVFKQRVAWLKANGKADAAAALEKEGAQNFAKRWTEAVVARMRELALEDKLSHAGKIKADFISKEQMDGPIDIHRARIIYVTHDDKFDASYKGLPQGFVERTGGPESDYNHVLSHVDILRRIGFSEDHGFGIKFSEKPSEQFVICCIAESQTALDSLMAHALKQVAGLPAEVQKKIRIEGIVKK